MKKNPFIVFKKFFSSLQEEDKNLLQEVDEQAGSGNKALPFIALSPMIDKEKHKHYIAALKWALDNREKKDIKNIAITGTYGSGKSSILKTFQEEYPNKKEKFLNISLATFKEVVSEKPVLNDDMLRLIELSIVQQILYHEKDSKTPDTRIKKIKKHSFWSLTFFSAGLLFFALSILNIVYIDFIFALLKHTPTKLQSDIAYYASLVSGTSLYILLQNRINRILVGIKVSKFNINNAEIEIDDKISKSILNHHLDEILYFFQVTNYDVVIIEDLDRFKETEIFTKLREINQLLNSSKKIRRNLFSKRHITFIYAVKDDMFQGKSRTKFFDYIIPVIPVVNFSNSSDILLGINKEQAYGISDTLIEDIAFFIDDMRLLNNIMNEFYLYRKNLSTGLNPDKLLAILVYKNAYPNDFHCLETNSGDLFSAISSKQSHIDKLTVDIDKSIKTIAESIHAIERESVNNIEELRAIYIHQYSKAHVGLYGFYNNGLQLYLSEMTTDENFTQLMNNRLSYVTTNSSGHQRIGKTFSDIEDEVSGESYQQRADNIINNNTAAVARLKSDIQELELKKINARALKIKDLFSAKAMSIIVSNSPQERLMDLLLREGYIAEDYSDYISIFYEGNLTKSDYQYLLNVRGQNSTDFAYLLNKIPKLISKIPETEFDKGYILNYNLVDFILSTLPQKQYKFQLKLIFEKLKDESELSIRFIDGYLDKGLHLSSFIQSLTTVWPNIWHYISAKPEFTDEKKDKYFRTILEYSNIKSIVSISAQSNFIEKILENEKFLEIISNQEKLKQVIKHLNIKFVNLNPNSSPDELLTYVYENSYYELNSAMIKLFLVKKGGFDQIGFNEQNYTTIKKSNCKNLIDYIDSDITSYIEKTYLATEPNDNEEEAILTSLLNNADISYEHKVSIINRTKTEISSLSEIEDIDIQGELLESLKVKPIWENVVNYYEASENTIAEPSFSFMNNPVIAMELSRKSIPNDTDIEKKYRSFRQSVLKCDEIENSSYELILKSIAYTYDATQFNTLSYEKVELLIKNGKISLSKAGIQSLKENHPDLHILLIEKRKAEFIRKVAEYELDSDDIDLLLASNILSTHEKNVVIESVDESILISNSDLINKIGEIVEIQNNFRISDAILKAILVNNELDAIKRVNIFIERHSRITDDDISNFLNSLGAPFSEILLAGKRPLLPKFSSLLGMLQILISRRFISKHNPEKNGIRVYTYTKNRD